MLAENDIITPDGLKAANLSYTLITQREPDNQVHLVLCMLTRVAKVVVIHNDLLEWSFYMKSLDLSLAAPKIGKIQISRFLRSVLE